MTGLQEAFYIIGIVFMGLNLILLFSLVVAVFVIRSKINRIHDNIENKINSVFSLAEKGGELASLAGPAINSARKALRKHKK